MNSMFLRCNWQLIFGTSYEFRFIIMFLISSKMKFTTSIPVTSFMTHKVIVQIKKLIGQSGPKGCGQIPVNATMPTHSTGTPKFACVKILPSIQRIGMICT